jgi:hypothetical protein
LTRIADDFSIAIFYQKGVIEVVHNLHDRGSKLALPMVLRTLTVQGVLGNSGLPNGRFGSEADHSLRSSDLGA